MLANSQSDKLFLIEIKYILHFIAIFHVLYTFLGFTGIDAFIISYFVNVSLLPWVILFKISLRFKFCYVHRLPLYYILLNDLTTIIDYYCNIPEDLFKPLIVQSILLGLLIFGYSYYYINCKLNK